MVTAALSASELRYRRLFEAAHDGILIVDPETRKIIDVNPFLVKFLGYAYEEFIGKELFEIGLLKDEAASQAAFRELQADGFIRYDRLLNEKACAPLDKTSHHRTKKTRARSAADVKTGKYQHRIIPSKMAEPFYLAAWRTKSDTLLGS